MTRISRFVCTDGFSSVESSRKLVRNLAVAWYKLPLFISYKHRFFVTEYNRKLIRNVLSKLYI